MAKFLLDTNICIYQFKEKYGIPQAIRQHTDKEFAISEITIAELIYGAFHSSNKEKHLAEAKNLKESISVLPISDVLYEYAQIRDKLTKRGEYIGDFDALIAATAIHYDLILITENIKHLSRIPDLRIENWVVK